MENTASKSDAITQIQNLLDQLEHDRKKDELRVLKKIQTMQDKKIQDISEVIDINSSEIRDQLKECHTSITHSITNRHSPWNVLNIAPEIIHRLRGIRVNAIVKANSLEPRECQQMLQDYVKVLAMTSCNNDFCRMGYIDDPTTGGQFTVESYAPGDAHVIGHLSLVMSLMNGVEIQIEKNNVQRLEQKTKELQQAVQAAITMGQRLEHRLQGLEDNAMTKKRKIVGHSRADGISIPINVDKVPDWTTGMRNDIPYVVSDGKLYSTLSVLITDAKKRNKYIRYTRTAIQRSKSHSLFSRTIPQPQRQRIRHYLRMEHDVHYTLYDMKHVECFMQYHNHEAGNR
jgi:hypothetical protein